MSYFIGIPITEKNVMCDWCSRCVTISIHRTKPYGWEQIGARDCCDNYQCRVRAGLYVPPPVVLATPVIYTPTPSYYDPTTVIVVQNQRAPEKKVVHKVRPRNGGFTDERL